MSLTEESGAAVFYNLKSAAAGVYYAFHNMARKGSVIKIMNPANHRIIYAKVIGPIPRLKEYHNAIVGLSSNAVSGARCTGQKDVLQAEIPVKRVIRGITGAKKNNFVFTFIRNSLTFAILFGIAGVVKLVDTLDLGSSAARLGVRVLHLHDNENPRVSGVFRFHRSK